MNARFSAALAMSLLALCACGGDDDPMGQTIADTATLNVSCMADGQNVCSASYGINGLADPTIALVRGQTYTFNVSVSGPHPFFIKTVMGEADGTNNLFDNGVTGQGTATVTFTVPTTAPDTLFYQCSVHSSMTGTLLILDAQ